METAMSKPEVFIVGATRTPIGAFQGPGVSLKPPAQYGSNQRCFREIGYLC